MLGAVLGLVVMALKFPAHTSAIFLWIEETFGLTPEGKADSPTPDSSETTPPTAHVQASTLSGAGEHIRLAVRSGAFHGKCRCASTT